MARIWDLRYYKGALPRLGTFPLESTVIFNLYCSLQIKKSAVSEDIPSKCSNQLCLPPSQPGERVILGI